MKRKVLRRESFSETSDYYDIKNMGTRNREKVMKDLAAPTKRLEERYKKTIELLDTDETLSLRPRTLKDYEKDREMIAKVSNNKLYHELFESKHLLDSQPFYYVFKSRYDYEEDIAKNFQTLVNEADYALYRYSNNMKRYNFNSTKFKKKVKEQIVLQGDSIYLEDGVDLRLVMNILETIYKELNND